MYWILLVEAIKRFFSQIFEKYSKELEKLLILMALKLAFKCKAQFAIWMSFTKREREREIHQKKIFQVPQKEESNFNSIFFYQNFVKLQKWWV